MRILTISDFLHKHFFYFLFTVGLFIALFLSINFHFDGSSVTPGDYFICMESSSRFSFFYGGETPKQVFVEERTEDVCTPQSHFNLVFLTDQKYYIEDDTGRRLTPQDDIIIMEDPSVSAQESQMWEIHRWKNSCYFTIKNADSGLSLIASDVGPVLYGNYIDNHPYYLFRVVPAS